jgi:hypothetical protein
MRRLVKLFAVAALALVAGQALARAPCAEETGACLWATCGCFTLWVTLGPSADANSPKRQPGWRSPFLPSTGTKPNRDRGRPVADDEQGTA